MINPDSLIPGQRYRVHYKLDSMKTREMIAVFIGTDRDALNFSLRPLAGTQNIENRWIVGIWETKSDLSLPTIYRGEKRVF